MNILYLQQHHVTSKGEGGVRGHYLMKALAARGHDVTVICGQNWRDSSLAAKRGCLFHEIQVDGTRIVQLSIPYSNKLGYFSRIRSFLLYSVLTCYQVFRRKADVIYASSPPLTAAIPALCAKWLKSVPYIFEVRDLWPDFPIQMGVIRNPLLIRLFYAWEWVCYRCAKKIVVLAPGAQAAISARAGISEANITMLPNGSDTQNLRPLKRSTRKFLPFDNDKIVFGYTGTLGRANGLNSVLNAAALLRDRGVANIAFVLIGDGSEKASLESRVRRESLSNVSFTPLFNKSVYNQVLAEIDVGMQILENIPAFYYCTSPNKFFDYLAAGKPVFVNYPGWIADLVSHHQCGVSVPPDDPQAFADAVVQMASNGDLLVKMGERARHLAETQFNQNTILQRLAQFIEATKESCPPSSSRA